MRIRLKGTPSGRMFLFLFFKTTHSYINSLIYAIIDNDYIAEPESIKAWLREFKDLPPAPPELIEALNNLSGNGTTQN